VSAPVTETARRSPDELRVVAAAAAARLADATADEVVRWAADEFGRRLAVTSSMADAVVVDLVSRALPGVDVLFLDTGYHFVETIGTRDAVAATYDVTVRTLRPRQTVAEQDATQGRDLFARDPDLCCALRKVEPLQRALGDYDAWVTGLRRDESPARAGTPVVAYDEKRGAVKVNPIAAWTQDDVDAYVAEHDVLTNPLLMDGFASVGCFPCTRRVQAGEDARAGRWAGTAKTECGIHT
jgi:phosphoadenosine phosphosulfate reductase